MTPLENSNNSNTKCRCVKNKNSTIFDRPVVSISLENNEIMKYKSMSEAVQKGFTKSAICLCCKGKRNHHKGYKWLYLEDYEKLQNSNS